MKYLRQARTHALALAGGQDDDIHGGREGEKGRGAVEAE
jgi:hypothetical protein